MVTQIAEARTHPPQDRYAQVGSIRTRFWQVGDKGSTVVLIHGLGSFVEMWYPNILALAEHHRVYAMDLVGHGRSDKPRGSFPIAYLARFVRDFLETQEVERASLIGASLGGGIALQLAETFPEKVEKLVLAAPGGLGREAALVVRLLALPILPELLLRPSRRSSAMGLRALFHDPALLSDELIDAHYRVTSLPGAQAGMLAVARSLVSVGGVRDEVWRPIVDNLGRIAAPTLVVWGKQDSSLPVAQAKVAEERLPNARVHIFDRCGHAPSIECAAEFNKLALEFLAI